MRSLPKLIAAFLALICTATAAERPNLLIILADDLGYSDLGCYGGEVATPRLDALAKGGLRFTQCYNTARCWPTRAALLTGYYAQQVRRDAVPGVQSGGSGVRPPWAVLLPTMLKPFGYRSYQSGKWHVDGNPLVQGFDHSYELADQSRFFSPRKIVEDGQPLPAISADSGYYATTAIADHAIKCLREHAEKHRGQPFFEYLAFTAPHFPLHALPEDIARYRDTYRKGWDAIRTERWERMKTMGLVNTALSPLEREVGPPYDFPQAITAFGPGEVNRPLPWSELTEAQREFQATKMAIHAAMIDRMDREIGRVLEQVKAMGAMENTLILFASDNGASAEIMVRGDGHDPAAAPGSAATHLCLGPGFSSAANTPFRRHKTWVHEGGISTPLIAHWPAGIRAAGELRHTPAHLVDIVPTFLSLAGAKQPEEAAESRPPLPGRSLAPAFAADVTIDRPSLWWLHEDNRALRIGDWKAVFAKADGTWELYDLAKDRAESNDLASREPERLARMIEAWTKESATYAEIARRDAPPAAKNPRKKAP